jgi:pantoate kinase
MANQDFENTSDTQTPISSWLRDFFARPEVQNFMVDGKQTAQKAGIPVEQAAEIADAAKRSAEGWLEKLEIQTKAKPLVALAVVFGAGLLVSWLGRGRK